MAKTTPTAEQLEAAAVMLNEAELSALDALQALLDEFDGKLGDIVAMLPQVTLSPAKRMVQELRGQMTYRRTGEVPNAINMLRPPEQPAMAAPLPLPAPPA